MGPFALRADIGGGGGGGAGAGVGASVGGESGVRRCDRMGGARNSAS